MAVSGLDSVRQSYVAKGFLAEGIHTFQASRWPSMAYEAHWSVFDRWCRGLGEDPFQVGLVLVLEFLNYLYHQGKASNTLTVFLSVFTAFRGNF